MTPPRINLGPHVDVRMERDGSVDPPVTRARFACRCGWTTSSSGPVLVVPESVKAHAKRCEYAVPDQLTIDLRAAS